ncbi:MAG: ABC transporter ATP-binding protein [Candidatus Omnitrophota bacterium]
MLVAKNVSKRFKQGIEPVDAVRGASPQVDEGERVCIYGPSGAGKSTFLQILGGLARPTDGIVTFRGKKVYGWGDRNRSRMRNRSFGFVFQFYHLLAELTALENVMLPAMMKGARKRRDIALRAGTLLSAMGMKKRLKHRPSQLSGGEAQRVAVARALINEPAILFCDEPTGNLDSEMSEEIYSLILGISEKNNMSVIVVSHWELRKGVFHSEYVMKDGVVSVAPKISTTSIGERISAIR